MRVQNLGDKRAGIFRCHIKLVPFQIDGAYTSSSANALVHYRAPRLLPNLAYRTDLSSSIFSLQ